MRDQFDHEKLEVYQLELSFVAWVAPLLSKVKQSGATVRTAEVIDQLDRASLSALLNTAEGNGRRQAQTRARFFDDARGSATECAACLDALVAKTLCSVGEINEGKDAAADCLHAHETCRAVRPIVLIVVVFLVLDCSGGS